MTQPAAYTAGERRPRRPACNPQTHVWSPLIVATAQALRIATSPTDSFIPVTLFTGRAHLELLIAKLRHEQFGASPERGRRLLDQLELQLEELEAAAAEDEAAALDSHTAADKSVRNPVRRRPAAVNASAARAGGDLRPKDGTETLEVNDVYRVARGS